MTEKEKMQRIYHAHTREVEDMAEHNPAEHARRAFRRPAYYPFRWFWMKGGINHRGGQQLGGDNIGQEHPDRVCRYERRS